MKKIFLIQLITSMFLLASFAAQAQDTTFLMNVYRHGTVVQSMDADDMDSIKFDNGNAVFHLDGTTWSRAISSIDSIAVALVEDYNDGDTTTIDTTGNAIYIHWNGTTVNIVNPFETQGVTISANGGDVSVASTAGIGDLVYVLSGTSTDGSMNITTDKKFIILMNNVTLANPDGPALKVSGDKRCTLHLTEGTSNSFSDGSESATKGTIYSDGRFELQGTGTLTVNGLHKNGIHAKGSFTMLEGTLQIPQTANAGLNVDGFIMYDGNISITNTANASKGLKSDRDIVIYGGNLVINANGTVELEELDNIGYDPSYCSGMKTDSNVFIYGGSISITCPATNVAGKGISADGNITITSGTVNITANGSNTNANIYTNEDGELDKYSASCLNADGDIYLLGGIITLASTGRNINSDNDVVIDCDSLTMTNDGNGYTIPANTTGTNATDGFAPATVKADGNLTVTRGVILSTSTGIGGRGMTCDGTYRQGTTDGNDDLVHIIIQTSGAPVNGGSTGGWGPGGGQSDIDYFKGLAKGLAADDTILINSGNLSVFCSQTSGETTAEAIESKSIIIINGGNTEANAYDDAVNVGGDNAIGFYMNGGFLWAYSRGNDGLDNNGSITSFTGGISVIQSDAGSPETAIDGGVSDAGGHIYMTGATVVAIGGCESVTMTGTQKTVSFTSPAATTGFCLLNSSGDTIMVFKSTTSNTSSNFQNTNYGTGTKPPPGGHGSNGIMVTTPSIVSGTYTLQTLGTVSGGENWHGVYTTTPTFSTNGTSTVTAQ